MTKEEMLMGVDLLLCLECSETRPVFAHQTCEKAQSALDELTELFKLMGED